ncbi:hypothetical protein PIROE2DRAFT_6115 [Piromyces sp. E2]|nr:hypothetical protein PIROE2DRAFT_6115 [Piromyces sp. E2]|eukprot:OUM66592.1 hypothetical protein PIROE2DRAFT_6115 [Piromyces sp. E2]
MEDLTKRMKILSIKACYFCKETDNKDEINKHLNLKERRSTPIVNKIASINFQEDKVSSNLIREKEEFLNSNELNNNDQYGTDVDIIDEDIPKNVGNPKEPITNSKKNIRIPRKFKIVMGQNGYNIVQDLNSTKCNITFRLEPDEEDIAMVDITVNGIKDKALIDTCSNLM